MRVALSVVVAAVVLVGCGGGGGGGSHGVSTTLNCSFPTDGCQALTAVLTGAQQTTLQTSCTTNGGAFAAGACTTAGMVSGHCHYAAYSISILGAGVTGAMDEYYLASAWTPQSAQDFCLAPPAGVWVP